MPRTTLWSSALTLVLATAIFASAAGAPVLAEGGEAASPQLAAQTRSSDLFEAERWPVPTRRLWLTVPEQPAQRAIYCCNASACFEVHAFKACFPNELIMVCDVDGICMPINVQPS
ncbi:MAG TPA: hypothetical protein VN493_09100 [Thermoanaerobaculia bacterium]|nr:hypothetical protein [Thermoanaerobaculia bacterium]